jgi:DNA ligase-1
MGTVIAEPKYDGLRIQIHINQAGFADTGLKYKAFTRNLEDVSHMFPELSQLVAELAKQNCDNCILDSEAIVINTETGEFVTFQETIQRKRKHGVADKAQELPIRFYVFDLLMLNDKGLLEESLEERKALLAALIPDENSAVLRKTSYIETANPEELKAFHHQQLQDGLEGAVMKMPSSQYVAGRKGWRWVKIKEEEGQRGKLSDTLDCVMMGYYFGKGKRQSFGIGALLVGVTDQDENGELVVKSISKIGTGLTDDQFREIKKLADDNLSAENKKPNIYLVDKNLAADKWLVPSLVLEIAADEITKSPIHKAGVALRFPRLIKIRTDKGWEEATSVSELANIKIS